MPNIAKYHPMIIVTSRIKRHIVFATIKEITHNNSPKNKDEKNNFFNCFCKNI